MKGNIPRTRGRLATMLSEHFKVNIPYGTIKEMKSPSQQEAGVVRWFVYANLPGRGQVWIHSWDRMGDIVQMGLAVVNERGNDIQVCANEPK